MKHDTATSFQTEVNGLTGRLRVSLLGVKIDPLNVDEFFQIIGRAVESRAHLLIANANVHCLNIAYDDPIMRAILNESDLVFCDGAGIVLGAWLTGQSLPGRMTGADWLWDLSEVAASKDYSFYFVGARPGIAEQAAANLQERNPTLRIAGVQHGYFDRTSGSAENEAVISAINEAQPDILFVGMGMPIQEYWLAENWDRLDVRVALPTGAIFDYVSGTLRRGPALLNDHGLEWLARLLIEPSRLWRRYLIGNPVFFWRVLGQAVGTRRSR